MTTRRRLALLGAATALLAVGALLTRVDLGGDGKGVRSVAARHPAFWSSGAPTCVAAGDPCWDFTLDVRAASGERLRLAIDHVVLGDVYVVSVTDPADRLAGTFSPEAGLYSQELSITDPAAGTWRVHVEGHELIDRHFRMRAGLERLITPSLPRAALAPNLQALPPHDLSFLMPMTNGSTDERPYGVLRGGGQAACFPEEKLESHPVRCLRMAFGVVNKGVGPMTLLLGPGEEGADRVLHQRVHYSDGTTADRVAGTAVFHTTHGHYHQQDAIELALFEVADQRRGELVDAGVGHRKGFAHRNEILRDWNRFYPVFADDAGFGLLPGWGDYYEWDRPGNFVDFGRHGDGRYVLRLTADPGDGVVESNEQDNTSYSYIEVTGTDVRVIESGRGLDPWDRCKVVMPIGPEPELPAGQQPSRRPRDCPRDG